jgi:fructose/tagatose bisphosphate aldolase
MEENVKTVEEIAQDYKAMGHSVELINGIIDGSKMADESEEDKKDTVKRNVEHLEIMVAKDYWTNEDMTAVNAAITAGKAYLA